MAARDPTGRLRLTEKTAHLCIDMQRLFAAGGPWATPWMDRVLPRVTALAARFPERTVFSRFMPPERPHDMPGAWRGYYEKWRDVTRERLDPSLVDLVEPLAALVPPATVIDKTRYSAFAESRLDALLRGRDIDTLVITGAETDVCVLASVMDAVDHGYHVILLRDAVCSSSDDGHDALIDLYTKRYSLQVTLSTVDEVLAGWR